MIVINLLSLKKFIFINKFKILINNMIVIEL